MKLTPVLPSIAPSRPLPVLNLKQSPFLTQHQSKPDVDAFRKSATAPHNPRFAGFNERDKDYYLKTIKELHDNSKLSIAQKQLYENILDGNLKKIKDLIEKQATINEENINARGALLPRAIEMAVFNNSHPIVKYILDKFPGQAKRGASIYWSLAHHKNLKMVDLLVKAGASPFKADRGKTTSPYEIFSDWEIIDTEVRKVREQCKDINDIKTKYILLQKVAEPLIEAAKNGNEKLFKEAELNFQTKYNNDDALKDIQHLAFLEALANGKYEFVDSLRQRGRGKLTQYSRSKALLDAATLKRVDIINGILSHYPLASYPQLRAVSHAAMQICLDEKAIPCMRALMENGIPIYPGEKIGDNPKDLTSRLKASKTREYLEKCWGDKTEHIIKQLNQKDPKEKGNLLEEVLREHAAYKRSKISWYNRNAKRLNYLNEQLLKIGKWLQEKINQPVLGLEMRRVLNVASGLTTKQAKLESLLLNGPELSYQNQKQIQAFKKRFSRIAKSNEKDIPSLNKEKASHALAHFNSVNEELKKLLTKEELTLSDPKQAKELKEQTKELKNSTLTKKKQKKRFETFESLKPLPLVQKDKNGKDELTAKIKLDFQNQALALFQEAAEEQFQLLSEQDNKTPDSIKAVKQLKMEYDRFKANEHLSLREKALNYRRNKASVRNS